MIAPEQVRSRFEGPLGRALVIASRLAIAGTFTFAAVPKLVDPEAFALSLSNYRAFPELLIGPIAVAVPVVELVVAVALVVGLEVRGAAIVAALLLVGFTAAMGQAVVRGIDVDCGCFGGGASNEIGWTSFARNALLLSAAVAVLLARPVLWPWQSHGGGGGRARPETTPSPPG